MSKGSRGMTLMHLMVYMAALPVVLGTGTALYFKTMDLFTKTETILDDLTQGQNLLQDLKRDLRRARAIQVLEDGRLIELTRLEGDPVSYRYDATKGSVDRTGRGGINRTYRSFSSFVARRNGKRLVDVLVTLKKSNEQNVFNPVWSTTVFCANLEADNE